MNGEIQKVDSDSRKELLAEQFNAIEAEAPAPEAAPEPASEASDASILYPASSEESAESQ